MRRCLTAYAAIALLISTPALAQSTPDDAAKDAPVADSGFSAHAPKTHFKPAEAAAFAKQIERNLAARDAHLAIVFRTGRPRDKLPQGIAYTHGAFWIYGDLKGDDGKMYKGYAVYNLYQGDNKTMPDTQSYLAQDFPINFVNGSQVDDVAVIIPSPEMQKRLIELIASPTYEKLHQPSYTLVSNPLNDLHQNCTEFLLDVVASAAWQTDSYPQIKADLRAHFRPTIVQAGLFQRVFGPMVDPALNLDDQHGVIETATYESIAAFMTANNLLSEAYVLRKDN